LIRFIKKSIIVRILNITAGHCYIFYIAEHIQFHVNFDGYSI